MALAARAQLEQGILYLRLGRDEQARQAFRKLITEFSDQPSLVREARAGWESTVPRSPP